MTLALSESGSDGIKSSKKGPWLLSYNPLPSFLYMDKLRFKDVKLLPQRERERVNGRVGGEPRAPDFQCSARYTSSLKYCDVNEAFHVQGLQGSQITEVYAIAPCLFSSLCVNSESPPFPSHPKYLYLRLLSARVQ